MDMIRLAEGKFNMGCPAAYDQSPSMYFGSPHTRASGDGLNPITTIASEPSDSDAAHWFKVEERSGVHWTEHGLQHFKITV